MALVGAKAGFLRQTWWICLVYWGFFVVLMIVGGYTVILDIRYIRLQYIIDRREAFRSTLGDERFRKNLRSAQKQKAGTHDSSRN